MDLISDFKYEERENEEKGRDKTAESKEQGSLPAYLSY